MTDDRTSSASSSEPSDSAAEPAGQSSNEASNGADTTAFEQAAPRREVGLLGELWRFLVDYRAWWLAPLIIALLLLTGLALLTSTGAAPFIYTLF